MERYAFASVGSLLSLASHPEKCFREPSHRQALDQTRARSKTSATGSHNICHISCDRWVTYGTLSCHSNHQFLVGMPNLTPRPYNLGFTQEWTNHSSINCLPGFADKVKTPIGVVRFHFLQVQTRTNTGNISTESHLKTGFLVSSSSSADALSLSFTAVRRSINYSPTLHHSPWP